MVEGMRAEASRAKRRLILEAGLDCFLKRGVGGTNLDHIRERCGASVGSFYHHFENKLEVAAALYLETLESYQRAFVSELRLHARAQSGIESTVRHHLQWVGQHPRLATYLTHCREPEVAAASEARTQELNRVFFDEVIGWLHRHAEQGSVRQLPSHLYYALWMGPAEVFTRLWLAGGQKPARLAEAAAILPPAAWDALRAASRAKRGASPRSTKTRRVQGR